jgi:hypothetical protein
MQNESAMAHQGCKTCYSLSKGYRWRLGSVEGARSLSTSRCSVKLELPTLYLTDGADKRHYLEGFMQGEDAIG